MAVVFTGFGPFGEVEYNPSWDCAQAAAEAAGGTAVLLEVTFEAARRAHENAEPGDLLVHIGVAANREHISLERFAHNWGADYGDPRPWRIRAVGPPALECALPLDDWAAALDGVIGRRCLVSHDAGTYVCNATLLHSLGAGRRAAFVHIPAMSAEEAQTLGRALARTLG